MYHGPNRTMENLRENFQTLLQSCHTRDVCTTVKKKQDMANAKDEYHLISINYAV
jgi:hypothetical protein